MNFQKLNINSNYYLLDQIRNNDAYNIESSYNDRVYQNSLEFSSYSYNPQNMPELITNHNSSHINYIKYCPSIDNSYSNQIIDYGKQINNLINLNNNLLIKKRKLEEKKENNNHKHTKYSSDNLQRRCKSLILSNTLEYLNYQIKKIYEGNIGNGIHIKKLFDINQEQKTKNSCSHLKKFLNKPIKEIFSCNISKKYTSFLPNHNEIIIHRALHEKDEKKRAKFTKLFNLTFADCIDIFLGKNKSEESEGFPKFDDIKYKLNDDDEYLIKIKEFLNKFTENLKEKKGKSNKVKK